jgi:ketoreductase RED2
VQPQTRDKPDVEAVATGRGLSLEGAVAVVTGSAHGIGEGIARRFAAAGVSVVINSRTANGGGEALATELPDATYVRADVSDADDARRLVDTALDRWGRLDLVVNAAGVSRVVPFQDLDAADDELWQSCLDVNVMGIWHVVRAAVPALRKSENPSITNVTSVAGIRPSGSSIPYAVSKASANHLTRLLASALAPDIRVNAVAPGFIETPLTDSMPPEFRKGYEETAVLGRVGHPDDIAEACLFLARSTYTTGEIVVVDGGLSIA